MEEERGPPIPPISKVTPTAVSLPPAQTTQSAAAVEAPVKRQMFYVELKPGETTIVSWKKLLKEARRGNGAHKPPPEADPALAPEPTKEDTASVEPVEGDVQDAPPANRFSAVIEKIERLYMGEQSSDEEELDDIPDDDQYDTEDSFIDDAELDEYFEVDKLSTKHNGFFINRGQLEKIESSSPSDITAKKRRRDSSKVPRENNHDNFVHEPVNAGNVRMKAAARNAPFPGRKSSNTANVQTNFSEHYQEGKILKNKVNTPIYRKRRADFTNDLENPSSLKIGRDVALLALETQHKPSHDRSVGTPVESQSRKLNGENVGRASTKVRRKEGYGTDASIDTNSAENANPLQVIQPLPTQVKEGTGARPKGTSLERAICDFEKIATLSRPPRLDIQEEDSSQGVKRRLPQEVKQKLAKVARLSANQNKVTEDEVIDRLMGTVGHLMQRKTLKRNMREMIEIGLSEKRQRADRFQQLKQEVNEMIQRRITLFKSKVPEQQDGSADDFQDANSNGEKKASRRYDMDTALEDKICDLYDLYTEGMDEDKVRQSKKLYIELAEMWPNGYMDNYGIKDAIFRSKDRKRARIYRHKARDEERLKRKKMAMAMKVEESSPTPKSRVTEKSVDLATQTIVPPGKLIQIATQSNPSSSDLALSHGPRIQENARSIDAELKKIKKASLAGSRRIHPHHVAKNLPFVPGPTGRPS